MSKYCLPLSKFHTYATECGHAFVWWLLQVLNEVVVDRGPSAFIGNLDLYIEHKCITSVQGDGLYMLPFHLFTLYKSSSNSLMRRSHHLNADRKYGVRSCGGSIDGASKRTRHRHRSCVCTLPLLPPHHHSCWCRNQGASHTCPNSPLFRVGSQVDFVLHLGQSE